MSKLCKREWNIASKPIRVMQWNVLADSCCDQSDNGFPYVELSVLENTEARHRLQLEQIEQCSPDLLALEEVDCAEHFQQWLSEHNYDCRYSKRNDSLLGIMMAWRQNVFEVKGQKPPCHLEGGQIGLISTFLHQETGQRIDFVATHLKAKTGNENLRLKQIQKLCGQLESFEHLIIAADLNDEPDKPVCKYLYDKGLSAAAHGYDFTTFKIRSDENGKPKTFRRIIDYVWHSQKFKMLDYLNFPKIDSTRGLPMANYPSDHIALCFDFAIKKQLVLFRENFTDEQWQEMADLRYVRTKQRLEKEIEELGEKTKVLVAGNYDFHHERFQGNGTCILISDMNDFLSQEKKYLEIENFPMTVFEDDLTDTHIQIMPCETEEEMREIHSVLSNTYPNFECTKSRIQELLAKNANSRN